MKQLKALASFLAIALSILIPSALRAQTAPPAPGSGVYILVDTTYEIGTVAEDTTTIKLWYDNTTTSLITGVQFRVWYDKNAFGGAAPIVNSLNTSFAQYLSYQPNTTNGYITITLAYTGSSASFSIPDGELFQIKLKHSTNFQNYYGSIDSIKVSGVTTFNNMAALNAGMDTTLLMHSYGGAFELKKLNFHGTFTNVTGTGAKNLTLALQTKPKTGSTWTNWATYVTDSLGKFAFEEELDTTYYDARLYVKGDTMAVGNIISTADAHKINQWVLGQATPVGFEFYAGDVNGSGGITISDAYGVFGRIAGRFSVWPNNVPEIKFFTVSEYSAINTATSYMGATYPGITNITYPILPGQPDSVTFYVLAPGDANGTGYHMARLTPIKIVNPNNAPNYIIDETVTYDNPNLETFTVDLPDLNVEEGSLVNIPVKVITPVQLSALQLALKYDPTLLEFRALQAKESVASWVTFMNPNNGVVEWGGYDPDNNSNLISSGAEVINLQFAALKPKPDWTVSPIYVTRKFGGDPVSRDMNIMPTDGRVEVKMIFAGGGINIGEIQELLAYPNPTSGDLTMVFNVTKEGPAVLGITDINGRLIAEVLNEGTVPEGKYIYKAELGHLPTGTYLAILKTEGGTTAKRVIKHDK
jgi:hypothetical protein